MKLGSEVLFEEQASLIEGKNVALLAHKASVNSRGEHIISHLMAGNEHGRWKLVALFGPEHGFDTDAEDMEPVRNAKTALKNKKIPVYSLYGDSFESLSPTPAMLKGVDVLIVDLQDVGARYYTYANTLALVIRVCAALGIEVVVCDRPNPINGITTEGGTVEPEFRSFVGMFPIPVRHGKTIGELASMAAAGLSSPKPNFLHVVPMKGWDREWYFDKTNLKWINPSPNMRSLSAAILYPGMCLLEGTNISEGRGTHTPFEVCGAPWIDGTALAKELRSLKLGGIDYETTVFTPTSRKFEGERCEGVQFVITDRGQFKSYLTGLAVIATIAKMNKKHFKWRREPYEFVNDIPAIDLLTGNSLYRKLVDKNKPLSEISKLA